MTKSIDPASLYQRRSRRETLGLLGAGAAVLGMEIAPCQVLGQSDDVLTEALVLRDPEIPVAGNAAGDITIVEYFDYQCPYCQRVNPDLNKLIDEYAGKVSVVYRDFPLPMHPHAEKAAEAARCAGKQGKFWAYHNLLFQDKKLDTPDLKQEATALHLDSAKFDKCLDSAEEAANVKKDQDEGMKLGLSGTPSFFINGHFISGAVDYTTLHQMVEQQLTLLSSAKGASPAGSSQR